ncbi:MULTISPECIES: PucR family transcriptional regulator [unclassified Micromonospora]|uniref:PucR family transcriptional regulator n=1 Tax=Micromonospora TaxID=1873 RepID=UPI00098D5709|nr:MULTISPECIES: PucR family transcriptional regulator [unclassified Micromonospora]MDI5936929.1 PucR family transcriptional regulator [Micromonospora sp. DH15]OON28507.1 CdaR family transcriptional regulator [Micromonospora sp. Rc5]
MSPVFPTVREILALDPIRHGAPRLVAGEAGLDRPVRWVHVAEVPDIASLLRGGELVLTTGIGLPGEDAGLRAFIGELADVGVSGLVVELGRRYVSGVPRVMAAAAARRGLPLVELRRATPFVRVTEAVHALIVDAQLTELRATEEIHQRFTELSVEGAGPAEVVRQAAELSGCPVVLENLSRQVLAYDPAGQSAELLLDGWEQHSRRISPPGRTAYDVDRGWLVTTVGARGQDWGRLLLRWPGGGELTTGAPVPDGAPEPGPADVAPPPQAPPTRLTILVERAASALALGRLIRRDAEGLERQIHRTLLTALLDHSRPVDEVALRARALGVVLERRHLVGVVVRYRGDEPAADGTPPEGPGPVDPEAGPARLRDLSEAVGQALREAKLTGLSSAVDDQSVGVLLALPDPAAEERALAGFAAALRRNRVDAAGPRAAEPAPARTPEPARGSGAGAVIVAAGSGVGSLREARRSLVEARQVADAARRDRRDLPIFRLPHVGLAGLLHLLRDEPRLQTFVERELGALLAYDARHPREQLLGTLRAYLEQGRNKSAAAAAAHLSRPAFYERLARIARILDADLDSVEVCLSLHVALLALDAVRAP